MMIMTRPTVVTCLPQHERQSSPGIGEYRLGVEIGQGSFACVVYGQHKETGKSVALKVTDRYSCKKYPLLVESLKREQSLLRRLGGHDDDDDDDDDDVESSSCIVKLLSSFVDAECVYLVLECCTGGTLQDSIQWQWSSSSPDSTREWSIRMATYGRQILQGLSAIHSIGFIHADLTPSNVLLTGQGHVRLADLGSAISMNQLDVRQSDGGEDNANNKMAAWLMTTTDYASPELVRGQVVFKKSFSTSYQHDDGEDDNHGLTVLQMIAIDVWAFGCLLFAAWTGTAPFHAASDALAVDRISAYTTQSTSALRQEWLLTQANNNERVETLLENEVWLDSILGFLHPNPQHRFREHGSKPPSIQQQSDSPTGTSSRKKVVTVLHERLGNCQIFTHKHDIPKDFDYSPRRSPDWWIQQQDESSPLRDGADYGWAAVMD